MTQTPASDFSVTLAVNDFDHVAKEIATECEGTHTSFRQRPMGMSSLQELPLPVSPAFPFTMSTSIP